MIDASIPAGSDDQGCGAPAVPLSAALCERLVVLADGSVLNPLAAPRRVGDGGWEIGGETGPMLVRDRDLWFSEVPYTPSAGDEGPPFQPIPIGMRLPSGARLEGRMLGIRIEPNATFLQWHRDGAPREVRIAHDGAELLEISMRAPGSPRVDFRRIPFVPPASATAAAPSQRLGGIAILADGSRLACDAAPDQLSDGSWHLKVDGQGRVLTEEQVWLVESDIAAPMSMVHYEAGIALSVVLPLGDKLDGQLLETYADQARTWMRWTREGLARTLWIGALAIAGMELTMRAARTRRAAGAAEPDQAALLPLLRTGADIDAYMFARAQGLSVDREVETHFLAAASAWQQCAGAAHDGEPIFALAGRLGLPLVDLHKIEASPAAISALPVDMARKFHVVPLRIRPNLVVVATDNPLNREATAAVEFVTGRRMLLLTHHEAVTAAISRYYDRFEDNALLKSLALGPESAEDSEKTVRENERLARQQPIVGIVSSLIEEAVRRRASDIHIRPRADDFEVLFRIDGGLLPVRTFAKPLLRAVTSRIKVLAKMNIAEHRLPQDGRITMPFEDSEIDIRISLLPSVHGESIVMRLLNASQGLRSLNQVGFSARDELIFRDLLARSHGMILVTGPTGCGKSTTLYAALLEVRKQDVNIITVEDPVEYHIPSVTQVQVNSGIGFTFASTLRNILRHDPDVVMLGEIRDHETAEIAVESALTGHLLLSTLHTNSAVTTITRLLDLGVEAFLLRSTLLGVFAQRLAKRNCRQCTEQEFAEPYIRNALGVAETEVFYRGAGCQHCSGTGVHGRIVVYELMPVTPAIRRLIVPNADGDAILGEAVAAGMVTITAQALKLARDGVISLNEAYRVRVE